MTSKSADFDPRRAEKDESFEYVDASGSAHTMKADEDGVLRPSNAEEQRVADLFSLPVARTVKQADKADAAEKKE